MRRLGLLVLFAGCRSLLGFDDLAPAVDAGSDMPLPDAGPCTAIAETCASDTVLRSCTVLGELPTDTACNWGCIAVGPHCGRLQPGGGVALPDDLDPDSGLAEITLDGATIDSSNGAISGSVSRAPGAGINGGIDYEIRSNVAIFRFAKLTITHPVLVAGSLPVILIVDGDVVLDSELDLRGTCAGTTAGPGGQSGATSGGNGDGQGAGGHGAGSSSTVTGGGGAGYGAKGGNGGDSNGLVGGPGGGTNGSSELPLLFNAGGSGGGGGAASSEGGGGGGGGGAIQIISNTGIAIAASHGINAGGCGGKTGQNSKGSGGGGGSGGAILLEAPIIQIDGGLAVNGGGGGGGRLTADGEAGQLGRLPAHGGVSSGTGGSGGAGGAATQLAGDPGNTNDVAGGGGGGVGRIRIRTRLGAAAFGAMGFTSPDLAPAGVAAESVANVQ